MYVGMKAMNQGHDFITNNQGNPSCSRHRMTITWVIIGRESKWRDLDTCQNVPSFPILFISCFSPPHHHNKFIM